MTLGGPWKPTRPRETANGRGFPQPLGKRFAFPTAPTAHDHSAHHRHATLNTCVPSAILPAPRPRWPLFNRSCLAGFQRPVTLVNGEGPINLLETAHPKNNGKGNLIIGYNEPERFYPPGVPDIGRTGSHNLVVGPGHGYTSGAGIVVGSDTSRVASTPASAGKTQLGIG